MTTSPKKIIILQAGMALVPYEKYEYEQSPQDEDSVIVHLSKYERVTIKKSELNFK